MRIRTRVAALAALPALALGASLAATTAASAAGPAVTGPFNYEVDTGGSWWLSNTPITEPGSGSGYADAGVVVDLGPLASLPAAPSGLTVTGSGPLADNLWISTGSDNAAVPGGPHSLAGYAGFDYGFDNHNGTFYMIGGPLNGTDANLAALQAAYPNAEAFAWAGVVGNNGASTVTGHVVKVNSQPAAANVQVAADGTASAR